MAILGGIGGLAGPVLGSFIITVLPEMLRGFADFRLVVNGVILVVIVLFLPQGIWDPARFKRWMRQEASAMLELSSVSKSFGGLHVLHDVNLSVPQGSIYGLIGPNGAGKTTVFNLITGLLPPSGGAITLNGDSLLRRAPHQITRMGIARTFQNIRLFKEMTLLENVVVGAYRHMNYGFPACCWACRDSASTRSGPANAPTSC